MSKQRTTAAIEKDIQQTKSDLEALATEYQGLVAKVASDWKTEDSKSESRLVIVAARLEAGRLRLDGLQAELQAAGTSERLSAYEAMVKAAQEHYMELQAVDQQISEQKEALQGLQKQRAAMVTEYRQNLLPKRSRLAAELAELVPGFDPGDLERKYSVPGYM